MISIHLILLNESQKRKIAIIPGFEVLPHFLRECLVVEMFHKVVFDIAVHDTAGSFVWAVGLILSHEYLVPYHAGSGVLFNFSLRFPLLRVTLN